MTQQPTEDLRKAAESLMQKMRYQEARKLLQRHLRRNPDDLKATLELALCALFRGADSEFLKLQRQAAPVVMSLAELPNDVAALWRICSSRAARLTGPVVVMGAVAASAGCQRNQASADKAASAQVAASGSAADSSQPISSENPTLAPAEDSKPKPAASTPSSAQAPPSSATTTAAAPQPTTTRRPVYRPAKRYGIVRYRPRKRIPARGAIDPLSDSN